MPFPIFHSILVRHVYTESLCNLTSSTVHIFCSIQVDMDVNEGNTDSPSWGLWDNRLDICVECNDLCIYRWETRSFFFFFFSKRLKNHVFESWNTYLFYLERKSEWKYLNLMCLEKVCYHQWKLNKSNFVEEIYLVLCFIVLNRSRSLRMTVCCKCSWIGYTPNLSWTEGFVFTQFEEDLIF